MESILDRAQEFGQMTEDEKKRMAWLIRRNGTFPSYLRKRLWKLASGAERSKRNNPGYYMESDHNR
jgi:hypothetical protein